MDSQRGWMGQTLIGQRRYGSARHREWADAARLVIKGWSGLVRPDLECNVNWIGPNRW